MDILAPFIRKNGLPKAIWAVGGGKGGVGKSLVSSNLAMASAMKGHSVTLVDLDLGSANLHTCLGMQIPPYSLSDFLSGRVMNLQQIIVPSPFENLQFICGFNDALNIADLKSGGVERLIRSIGELNTDIVILDLGAGTADKVLDFFLMAHRKIVVVVPEPTSIENAYRFIKSSFYRQLRLAESQLGIQWLVEEAMDHKNKYGIRSPHDLFQHIQRRDPIAGQKLIDATKNFQLDILINQVRTRADLDLGDSIKSVCRKYFGVESHYLGYLDYDNAAWQALRKKRPLIAEFPHSSLVHQFDSITQSLVGPQKLKAVI